MIEKGIVRKADASRLSDGKIAVELVVNERTWCAMKFEFKEIVGLVAACNFTDNDFPLSMFIFFRTSQTKTWDTGFEAN